MLLWLPGSILKVHNYRLPLFSLGSPSKDRQRFVDVFVSISASDWSNHGLFKNGWETRSRDVWKPVSTRTPGISSKICDFGGGTPALLRPAETLQDFALLDLGKNDSSSKK